MPEQRMPTLMSIIRHRLTRLLLAVVLLVGALQLAAPTLIRVYAVSWLKAHGATHAEIRRVRVNPWRGRLSLSGLKAGEGLAVGHAAIDIDWWPLWHHHIDLLALHLEQARIHLQQRADGRWGPAGLRLPPAKASAHPWLLILHGVHLRQVHIELAGQDLKAQLPIERMSMTLASLSQAGAQVLNAELKLGQGHADIGGFRATDSTVSLRGQLLLTPDAPAPGARHLAIRARGLQLQAGQSTLAIGSMQLDGIATRGHGDVEADGLDLQDLKASLPRNIDAGIGHLEARQLRLGQGLSVGGIKLAGLTASAPDGLALGGADHATLDGLSLGPASGLTFSRLTLQGVALPATPRHALGRVDSIAASDGAIDDGLRLGRLQIKGLDLSLLHRQHGLAVIPRLRALAAASAGAGGKAALHIDSLGIDAGSRIHLHDAAIDPPFDTRLGIDAFALEGLDTQGKKPATVAATLRVGDEGRLTVKGSFRLHDRLQAADMHLDLKRLSMPPLSGYAERDFGNAIDTGQMDLDSRIRLHGDVVQAQNRLVVRSLALKPMPQSGKAMQALGMPLGIAVDMLKDDRGDIALNVPVSGRLGDTSVHLSDAFDQALASAMRSAALSSASLLLQPYGSILPALSMAADLIGQASRPRLTPIAFAAHSTALSKPAQAYIARIALLLQKKKDFRLQVCGVAASGDFLADGTPGKKGSAAYNQMLTLAASRSSKIVKALVAAGVDPGRLFSCRPHVDANSHEGRVELIID